MKKVKETKTLDNISGSDQNYDKQLDKLIKQIKSLYESQKYKETIESCDKALKIDPNCAFAWYIEGKCLDALGEREEIDANTWTSNGTKKSDGGYNYSKNYQEAIECYDEALKIDPNCAFAWTAKGYTLRNHLSQYKEAIQCWEKAREINQANVTALYKKAATFEQVQSYSEAIECYDKVIEIEPLDALPFYKKGLVFFSLENYQEAIECYDEALGIDQDDATIWYNKGLALRSLGKLDEANRCFEKHLQLLKQHHSKDYDHNSRAVENMTEKGKKNNIKWYTSDGKPVYE